MSGYACFIPSRSQDVNKIAILAQDVSRAPLRFHGTQKLPPIEDPPRFSVRRSEVLAAELAWLVRGRVHSKSIEVYVLECLQNVGHISNRPLR